MVKPVIDVEVVYAAVDRQMLLKVAVPVGTTLRAALAESGIVEQFPELDLATCPVGVFGKVIADPEHHQVRPGDRIEIYRALLADPKEVRRLRAAKAAAQAKARDQ
ncbi:MULTISPECIES: RnfH family protein [unclassified Pseudomonas]|uniref:RnfH family protein n=1 Tax=unclassified Pseudomonas TaxID=196821 RepID=UPI000CD1A593|nr:MULTISPECIES: RnfH family protein [unclassified Pseudomonas]POA28681.1 RnfH family protein [Pseudomonas sp. GW456-R21]POA64950.1 RnfH family protein [Pseudomonas sp. GW460-R15]